MTGVTLVSGDAGFAARLTAALGLDGCVRRVWQDEWSTVDAAVTQVLLSDPDVVVVGPGFAHRDDQLDLLSALEARRPEVALIAVGDTTGELALAAMRAGARDLVAHDVTQAGLAEVVQRALAVVERRRSALAAEDGPARRVVTVVAPKGGAGKTTVATNLAVALARADLGPVLLVDLDLQFGDVASALGLEPDHDLATACRAAGLDRTALKMFLTRHGTGLYVLPAPESLVEADHITGDELKAIFGLLVDEFPWIVVDTSSGIDEAAIVAMEFATDLVFVGSTDVPAVRAVRRQLDAMDRIGMTDQARHLVLNRADARVGLDAADIAATLGLPVAHRIPSSRLVPISTNQGTPVVLASQRDPVTRAFTALAESFLPERARSGDKRRWRRSA